MVLHLLYVPAAANAEDETTARQLVEAGDALRRYDRLALRDQTDAGAEQQLFRRGRGKRECDERIVDMRVALSSMDFAAARERSSPAGRDVRVLRHVERGEAALFERTRELADIDPVIGVEIKNA